MITSHILTRVTNSVTAVRILKLLLLICVLLTAGFLALPDQAWAVNSGITAANLFQTPAPDANPIGTIKGVPVPGPSVAQLANFIADKDKATALGKALFWDMQVGSDGIQACATCHFHAGADSRRKNQLSPGLNAGDSTFQIGGPNYEITPADFPFHRLADPNNRNSAVLFDTNDVMSSQGVVNSSFIDIITGSDKDFGNIVFDPIYNVGGINVRRVEPRNTPTAINAVFNFRNFWDGRAQNDFNGVNPFGNRDVNARVLRFNGASLTPVSISLSDSSLASQAVGPPLSDFEMSQAGRIFQKLGKKLLTLQPLARQDVDATDSALAGYRHPSGKGLSVTYEALIKAAFKPEWWNSPQIVTYSGSTPIFSNNPGGPLTSDQFTQMEANFALFFGLAIQCYEATLVSDDTPFDRFEAGDTAALTLQQQEGRALFVGKAKCANCHGGPELTNASVRNVRNNRIERMLMGNGQPAVYDNGFYNIGVRPTNEDIGVGGLDPFGNPLSFSRLFQLQGPPFPNVPGDAADGVPDGPLDPNERIAVRGAFKTPGLRNVELTAPYFHNGGQFTLRQVVEFYNRGGDFANQNIADLDPDIQPLGLTEAEKDALVAFLLALTDERVRYDRAPFDHPSLLFPECQVNRDGRPSDIFRQLSAIGTSGFPTETPNFLSVPSCAPISVAPSALPGAINLGEPFSQTFTVTGATSPDTLELQGHMPTGLMLAGNTISGIPTETGTFSFRVVVTDVNGCSVVCSFALEVIRTDMPGALPAQEAPLSDQKAGSVLIFPIYSSSPSNPAVENTRINLTNSDSARDVTVHLFFVDGSNCSVADSYVCLTKNQTMTVFASDVDPGVTGYVIAVAVDRNSGRPINFNFLIGDEYVKFQSGHAANLGAEAIAARVGSQIFQAPWETTATMAFDGFSYNMLPRMLAASSIPSQVDGNQTMLIINRIGGSLLTSASPIGTVFGILFDELESPYSFSFTGGCQFRNVFSNNFPRTTPRLNQVIPAGSTGWMKLQATGSASDPEPGIIGTMINFNAGAGINSSAFNQGHNLHKLTFTPRVTLTIPVFPPSCR